MKPGGWQRGSTGVGAGAQTRVGMAGGGGRSVPGERRSGALDEAGGVSALLDGDGDGCADARSAAWAGGDRELGGQAVPHAREAAHRREMLGIEPPPSSRT